VTGIAKADSVISTIPVGTHPQGIAFDPSNGDMYVANAFSNSISVISGSTNQLVTTIPLSMQPRYIVFDSVNGNMYVAGVIVNRNPTIGQVSDTLALSVISSSTNQVIGSISLGGGQHQVGDITDIAFDQANGNLYVTSIFTDTVANVATDRVFVIPTVTNQPIATIPISGPVSVVFDPANGYVYVASSRLNMVFIIDTVTNRAITTLPLGVTDIAFDSANGNLYTTGLNRVYVISSSTNHVISTIPLANPDRRGIAYNSANGNMYVTNYSDNSVSVISTATNQVINTIPVGTHPQGIAFDPSSSNVYVTNTDSNSVSIISTVKKPPALPPNTTPPSITVPNSIAAEATSHSGAAIIYPPATATDNVDGTITPVCNPPPGSQFPIGDSTVTCTATDRSGYTAKARFTIKIQDTIPPDTTITSVVDSTRKAITNGSSTLYSSIQIAFSGTDNVGIAGFQCILDGQAVSQCTSPVTFNNLAAGIHTFNVRAIDTSNNPDSTPASFSWTLLTPAQYAEQLLSMSQRIPTHKYHKTIAFIEPTFTYAAYQKGSFYNFYDKYQNATDAVNKTITTDLDMLKNKPIPHGPFQYFNDPPDFLSIPYIDYFKVLQDHVKRVDPFVTNLTDVDVHEGNIFRNDGSNAYDVLFMFHNEYVTASEYNNLRQFVSNGGTIIFTDANIFFAEVSYNKTNDSITLARGHYWKFVDGIGATRSVSERWLNENKEWMGSNFFDVPSNYKIYFRNNPFNYTHSEEQYVTNPNAKILINYETTYSSEKYPNPTIATYYMYYGKGRVINLGIWGHTLVNNKAFLNYFDHNIIPLALGPR
jgi:YVTN family beta-propeller protein